ncbi:hypothetical protein [Azospirillum soli]|uniref:hypothetical protein n=1 Tax=Azospirillum soli TaxID=1304799 RepID=UPI001FE29080|nr:hypothetical protein [Azospirillum soli]MBP2310739.1 hypothetical protein [Azospirillum soli]
MKAKLVDAVDQRPDLDLIVFGATREISLDDERELVRLGVEQGIGVVVIDWPKSATMLPPLAVLCALAPEAVLTRIDAEKAAAVKSCLDWLGEHPGFPAAAKDLLDRLTAPDMGWGSARRCMADWLRETFSRRNYALSRLHGLVNLLDDEARRGARPRLMEVLDRWWASHASPLALLGDEGVGKSWAPLGWWHERAGPDGSNLPLCLVIPARDVTNTDVEGLVARLLARRTRLRDEEFWRRRVRLWLKTPAAEPRFLLVFDGLNEHWTFRDWGNILAQLAEDPWRGRAAVIMTCRPDHWRRGLNRLASVKPAPLIQAVDPFDDAELDSVLQQHGLSRADFVPGLLPLLKVPRLCNLAIRHRAALSESGDITRERLAYEDWKDRLSQREGHLRVNDAAFHEFIAALGRRLHGRLGDTAEITLPLTRRELTEELGASSGDGPEALYSTVSEIVDGRWMVPVEGRADRFRLNTALAPYALGMALVERLREMPEGGIADELAAFLDPLREQDLAVDLLRAAVTIALIDGESSAALGATLLRAWLDRQNFRGVDFDAFWRLIPQDLALFTALAEETWLHRHTGHHTDEVLIKGFANAADRWPDNIGARILAWCAVWLGTHWGDPVEGMVINYDPEMEGAAERIVRTRERRASWDSVAGALNPEIPIRAEIGGDTPWLACRVLGILSYMPRARVVPALTAWAVSRAIMGGDVQGEQVAWILRYPHRDENEPEDGRALQECVRQQAERLLALSNNVADDAARRLLAAFAAPDAARQAESLARERVRTWRGAEPAVVRGADGLLTWTRPTTQNMLQGEEAPLSKAGDLNGYAVDPVCRLSEEDAKFLGGLADATDAGRLWRVMGNTSDDAALGRAEAALARWAPNALGNLYRRIFAGAAERPAESLDRLAFRTPSHVFLLGEDERAVVSSLPVRSVDELRGGDGTLIEFHLAALAGRTAAEQIAFFSQQPDGPDFDAKHAAILAEPTSEDFATVAEELQPDAPPARLCGWLWYLLHIRLDALPPGYPALVPLLEHEDQGVRKLALEVVHNARDPELSRALAGTSWRCTEGMDREEVINGSLALIEAAAIMPAADIRSRVDPEAWGFLAIREGATEEDLDAFAGYVEKRIHVDLFQPPASRTIPRHYFILNCAIDRLVERRGDQVVAWVQPLLTGSGASRRSLFFDEFPYNDICRALLRHRPAEGMAMWKVMRRLYERSSFRSDEFSQMPFEAPDSEPVDQLRHLACDLARTDQDLGRIATAVIDHGRQAWLIDRIRRDLAAPLAGEIARGLWFAGLLDVTDAAESLWRTTLAEPPALGWLAEVHARAKGNYRRNLQARHWLDEFLDERDVDRAFGRHRLFLCCADRRVYAWAPRRLDEVWEGLPKAWRTHLSLCGQALNEAVEKRDKEWKETLFGTRITTHIQWPWR